MPGKLADMVVLSDDIFDIQPDDIRKVKTEMRSSMAPLHTTESRKRSTCEEKATFVRPAWEVKSDGEIYEFMQAYPWAILASNGREGPVATNLPLLLDQARGGRGVLVGRIARANQHLQALESSETPALAIFQGPYSYVTSSWYPNRDMPPTFIIRPSIATARS